MGHIELTEMYLDEAFSPIPAMTSWSRVCLDRGKSADRLELFEMRNVDRTAEVPVISAGPKLNTTKGALAKAYREEWSRIVETARRIAPHVRVLSSTCPLTGMRALEIASPVESDLEGLNALFSRKVNRLLRRAAERCGKDPNPLGPMIFSQRHWHSKVRVVLQDMLQSPHRLLWLSPAFLPAFSSAFRELQEDGNRIVRSVEIKLRVASLADIQALLRSSSEILQKTGSVWDVDSYLRIGDDLETLTESARSPMAHEVSAIFYQETTTHAFRCLCIGLGMPRPPDGFSLELVDGTRVRLSTPPWCMAMSILPQKDEDRQ